MSKRWSIQNLKDKGIFVNQDGVGKILAPPIKKKVITEADIEKAIKKASKKKNGINKEKREV